VYFDYVRLSPAPNSDQVESLWRRALQPRRRLERGSVEEKKVAITVRAPRFDALEKWPVRCGLPIPQGELADSAHVAIENAAGEPIATQARTLATWPDGSVKWLALDFRHSVDASGEGTYRVLYGNRVRALDVREKVTIRSLPEGLEVDTGAI